MSKTSNRVGFSAFEVADYLKTETDITEYLAIAAEDGDPAHFARALGHVTRARSNMSQLARKTGLSREGIYKAFSGEGNPSLATTMRVMDQMGVRFSVVSKGGAAKIKTQRSRKVPRVAATGQFTAARSAPAARKSGKPNK